MSLSVSLLVDRRIEEDEIDLFAEISELGSIGCFLWLGNFWPICGNGSVYLESREESGRVVIAFKNEKIRIGLVSCGQKQKWTYLFD